MFAKCLACVSAIVVVLSPVQISEVQLLSAPGTVTLTTSSPTAAPSTGSIPHNTISADTMGTTFARGLLSGAATRAAKEALLHPLDTLKTREQLPALLSNGSAALAKLYSGVVPAVIGGIPAGAVFFGVKDLCKEQLRAAGVNRDVATLVGVCAANLPYWLIRTPAELLKTRQQANVSLLGPFQDLLDVTRRAGLAGAYSAYWSNVAYAVPADVLKFIAYDAFASSLFDRAEGGKIEGLDAAVAGALAGAVAQIATTPILQLDVVRTRSMVEEGERNPLKRLRAIAVLEGSPALLKGWRPRIVRAFASGAVQFASYEIAQNFLSGGSG